MDKKAQQFAHYYNQFVERSFMKGISMFHDVN